MSPDLRTETLNVYKNDNAVACTGSEMECEKKMCLETPHNFMAYPPRYNYVLRLGNQGHLCVVTSRGSQGWFVMRCS